MLRRHWMCLARLAVSILQLRLTSVLQLSQPFDTPANTSLFIARYDHCSTTCWSQRDSAVLDLLLLLDSVGRGEALRSSQLRCIRGEVWLLVKFEDAKPFRRTTTLHSSVSLVRCRVRVTRHRTSADFPLRLEGGANSLPPLEDRLCVGSWSERRRLMCCGVRRQSALEFASTIAGSTAGLTSLGSSVPSRFEHSHKVRGFGKRQRGATCAL